MSLASVCTMRSHGKSDLPLLLLSEETSEVSKHEGPGPGPPSYQPRVTEDGLCKDAGEEGKCECRGK